jgi:hypothetical protein
LPVLLYCHLNAELNNLQYRSGLLYIEIITCRKISYFIMNLPRCLTVVLHLLRGFQLFCSCCIFFIFYFTYVFVFVPLSTLRGYPLVLCHSRFHHQSGTFPIDSVRYLHIVCPMGSCLSSSFPRRFQFQPGL